MTGSNRQFRHIGQIPPVWAYNPIHEPHRRKIKNKDGVEIETSNDNTHVHFAVTMRCIGPDGFGDKNRDWNQREMLKELRKAWAVHTNAALQNAGSSERIDHRTLAEQHEEAEIESYTASTLEGGRSWADKTADLDRPPQRHMGKAATALERKGETTELGDYNRQIAADLLDRQMSRLDKQIRAEEIKLREEAATLAAMQEKARTQDIVVQPEPPKYVPASRPEIKVEKKQEVVPVPDTTRFNDPDQLQDKPITTISRIAEVQKIEQIIQEPVSPIKPVVAVVTASPSTPSDSVTPLPVKDSPIQNLPVKETPLSVAVDPAWYLKTLELIRELVYRWRTAVRQGNEPEEKKIETSILAEVVKAGHKRIHFDETGPIMLDDTKAIINLIGAEKKRLGIPPIQGVAQTGGRK